MTTVTAHAPFGRGCGTRSAGACYLACGLSLSGNSIEHFIIDPVRQWPGKFQRGFQLLPVPGKDYHHVVIFVGESFYASPWTFIEEVSRFGTSRKVPPTFPFDKIQPGKSQMYFVHSKAYVDPDKMGFYLDREPEVPLTGCKFFADDRKLWDQMKDLAAGWHPSSERNHTACTFAHRDLACIFHKGEEVELIETNDERLEFKIKAPSFSYMGRAPSLPNVLKLEETYDPKAFSPGIFLRLPISHFESYKKAGNWAEKAQKAGFEVIELDY